MSFAGTEKNNVDTARLHEMQGCPKWLFPDSEPEAKPATPKGPGLDGF